MPNTPNTGLFYPDKTADGEINFNTDTMLKENWDKIDEKLGAQIAVSPGATQLDFTYGIQALTMPRTAQFHMNGITGRTLINLLGRDGGCESLTGWLSTNAALSLDTTNKTNGINGIKVNASVAGDYSVFRVPALPTVVGERYLFAVDVKNGNTVNTNFRIAFDAIEAPISVTNTFQTIVKKGIATVNSSGFAIIATAAAANEHFFIDAARVYKLSQTEYDALDTMTPEQIAAKYPYVDDMKSIMNPYAICYGQSEVLPYTKDQMIVIPTQLASNADGSVADELYRIGSEYWVNRRFKVFDIPGNAWGWAFDADYAGFKRVKVTNYPSMQGGYAAAVKYDGKILATNIGTHLVPDCIDLDSANSILYVSIADADSGWGEDYTPTPDEIKACIDGWKLVVQGEQIGTSKYNGIGTKAWCEIYNALTAPTSTSAVTTTLPTTQAPDRGLVKPYKLQHQLATPTAEQIIPEGEITLIEGLNQVETGVGMIVRERANPVDPNGLTFINQTAAPASALEYRTNSIREIYKDNKQDKSWIVRTNVDVNNGFGGGDAYKDTKMYDPSAAYTVTYLALDQYSLSCSFDSIQGEYDTNLKTGVDRMARNQAEIATRISVLETQKAGKVQPQWINAPLLAGWAANASIGVQYRKTADTNKLEMRVSITSGTTARGTVFAILPYKPAQGVFVLTAETTDGGSNNAGLLGIGFMTDGSLRIDGTPGTGAVSLAVISFTAIVPLD